MEWTFCWEAIEDGKECKSIYFYLDKDRRRLGRREYVNEIIPRSIQAMCRLVHVVAVTRKYKSRSIYHLRQVLDAFDTVSPPPPPPPPPPAAAAAAALEHDARSDQYTWIMERWTSSTAELPTALAGL
jgi:hypothetical protein